MKLEKQARSKIYLAAWMAAEDALPPESKALIQLHDALHRKWRDAGWPLPIPEALLAASAAVEADPLASIPFGLRHNTNDEAYREWELARQATA